MKGFLFWGNVIKAVFIGWCSYLGIIRHWWWVRAVFLSPSDLDELLLSLKSGISSSADGMCLWGCVLGTSFSHRLPGVWKAVKVSQPQLLLSIDWSCCTQMATQENLCGEEADTEQLLAILYWGASVQVMKGECGCKWELFHGANTSCSVRSPWHTVGMGSSPLCSVCPWLCLPPSQHRDCTYKSKSVCSGGAL